VCLFLLEIDIFTKLVLSLYRVGLKNLCRTVCVCKCNRCCVIFEVLKALMLRIQFIWLIAVTGFFIPEVDDSAIRQKVRNQ